MEPKYRPGDRVRICSEWNAKAYLHVNPDGQMDHWKGKVMTIKGFDGMRYKMEEDEKENDCDGWYWIDCMIEGLADDEAQTKFNEGLYSLLY